VSDTVVLVFSVPPHNLWVKETNSAVADGVCHASIDEGVEAREMISALVAVPGHSPAPAPRRGFEGREKRWLA
jgi:hypothetical protein